MDFLNSIYEHFSCLFVNEDVESDPNVNKAEQNHNHDDEPKLTEAEIIQNNGKEPKIIQNNGNEAEIMQNNVNESHVNKISPIITDLDQSYCEYQYDEEDRTQTYKYKDGRTIIHKTVNYGCSNDTYNEEHHMLNGKLHRLDGPALISYDDKNVSERDGEKYGWKRETWYKDGKTFRDGIDQPTRTTYHYHIRDGTLRATRLEWLDEEGQRHRGTGYDKPARIDIDETGWKTGIYYIHGRFDQTQ